MTAKEKKEVEGYKFRIKELELLKNGKGE